MDESAVRAGADGTDELDTNLKRAIGPGLLTVFVIGDILGAGIYALVGEVGAETGGAIWTAFMAAFVLALFTAFAYAELVSKYPQAAGAALYTQRAFRMPFFTFMVAFAVMSSGIASASTLRRDQVDHDHFQGPAIFPILGALVAAWLLVDTALDDFSLVLRALILLAVGVVLWAINRLVDGPPENVDAERLEG